jgi:hypothetical protein
MGESRFALTVYIAPPFSRESQVGHMWVSLDDNQTGLKENYGFHPANDGEPLSPRGKVKTDDDKTYTIILLQRSFPITEETYHNVHQYCQRTLSGTFGPYIAVGNACVNYAWDIMKAAGIGEKELDYFGFVVINDAPRGVFWPASNYFNLQRAYDYHMAEWNDEHPKTRHEALMEKMRLPW